jgi:hypothetical protein
VLLDDEVLRLLCLAARVGALDGVPAQDEAVAWSAQQVAAELRAPGPVPAVAGRGWARGPERRVVVQGVSTDRTPASPVACRRQARSTAASGSTSCATPSRPAAACPSTAASASARCPGVSALLV